MLGALSTPDQGGTQAPARLRGSVRDGYERGLRLAVRRNRHAPLGSLGCVKIYPWKTNILQTKNLDASNIGPSVIASWQSMFASSGIGAIGLNFLRSLMEAHATSCHWRMERKRKYRRRA
jgi:hypothetical protein